MKRSDVKVSLAITLLFASLISGAILSAPIVVQSVTFVWPDNFPSQTLQQAIWNETVNSGDTIVVRQGTYYVNLNVNKSITLEGFDRNTTILDGSASGAVVIVNANNVNILEFTIQHGYSGIVVLSSIANVSHNIIKSNGQGIALGGSNSVLRDNDIKSNTYNFGSSGGYHDIDTSNKVDGKPICYLVGQHDKEVPGDLGYVPGYIGLVNSRNITVRNLSLKNNGEGVLLASSANITIEDLDLRYVDVGVRLVGTYDSKVSNNTIRGDGIGIYIADSENNVLSDNLIQGADSGIDLFGDNNTIVGNNIISNQYIMFLSSNNSILSHNNFINNPMGVFYSDAIPTPNSWNNTLEGNYWDTVSGVDIDGDGINDPPCNKSNGAYNIDYHPLNQTWSPTRAIDVTWYANVTTPPQYFNVTILSDHVVARYRFKPYWSSGEGSILFNVTAGTTGDFSGYFNVTIPRNRLDYPFALYIDGSEVDPSNYVLTYAPNYASLYFAYAEGRHMVEIKGDRLGTIFGDITGPNGVPDGVVNMRDIGAVANNFGKSTQTLYP